MSDGISFFSNDDLNEHIKKVMTQTNYTEEEAKERALGLPEAKKWLDGKEIKKVIFVPDKVVNFVV